MQSIINEEKLFKIEKYFKSKWANLKFLLQNKTSFESSIDLLKKQTIEQFSTKCLEIYQDRIATFMLFQKNKNLITYFNVKDGGIPKITVKASTDNLTHYSLIKDFLFYIRENNQIMLTIINDVLRNDQRYEIVPFLCHFFYENFFGGSEQEEIIYLIYLLLEKEIDKLLVPFPHSFLDSSFLSDFFIESRQKYEIKKYLEIIINSLIRDLEEQSPVYHPLNIISNSIKDYKNNSNDVFFDMTNQSFKVNELFAITPSKTFTDGFLIIDKRNTLPPSALKPRKIFNKILKKKKQKEIEKEEEEEDKEIKYETKGIDNFINKNFFNIITNNTLKKNFANEKDELMKCFFMKQLKIINLIKNPNAFNCKDLFYNKMVKTKDISMKAINEYNEGYKLITTFISNLLNNLENKVIIPYYIKVICRIIYNLLKKKFKNITQMQINAFIFKFLFNKIIIPTLQNPDYSDVETTIMITLLTRKNILRIERVLKQLISGELFYEEVDDNLKIFNQFIIDSYRRLGNIVKIFIDVKLPKKIMHLMDQFYGTPSFSLDELKRQPSEINYNYFEENPNDFMQHYCICFNYHQFIVLYSIILSRKDLFLENNRQFETIFNKVTDIIPHISMHNEKNMNAYYLAIKENFNESARNLLYHKEKKIGISKIQDILYKLKYCIVQLLSKMEVFPNWSWVKEGYDTKRTFDFINKYLIIKERKKTTPLNWYSKCILDYLEKIDKKYIENDYDLLYKEIEYEIRTVLCRLNELNEFLTVDIETKYFIIENKKNRTKKELKNMAKIELNLRSLFFIETQEIAVCLMKGEEYNQFKKNSEHNGKKLNKNMFVISKENSCPHHNIELENYEKMQKIGKIGAYWKKNHCLNIKQFSKTFSELHSNISSEIMNRSFDKELKKVKMEKSNLKEENQNMLITESPKKILDFYMNFLSEEIDTKTEIKDKEQKNKMLRNIMNYILNKLSYIIYTFDPLGMDEDFNAKCKTYSQLIKSITPKLTIPEIMFKDNLLESVKYHIQKMEHKRTPDGMNEEFGKAVQLINSLYKFYFNQNEIDVGESLYIIIYCIILTVPKRIFFNVNFTQFFLSGKELADNIGYNMTQAESAINYIRDTKPNDLGLSSEELNKVAVNINI